MSCRVSTNQLIFLLCSKSMRIPRYFLAVPQTLIESEAIRERLSSRFRTAYHDRNRTYALRDSEIFTLTELGKFRVISTEDLRRFAYDGNQQRLEQDVQSLRKQGLISQREIEAGNQPKFHMLSLTKDGKRFLEHQNRVPKSQAVYAGFVKPKELAHDADLYRPYQKVSSEIERSGGTVRRVVLDYELKEELYRALSKVDPAKNPDYERMYVANRHGLKVLDGKIPIPDLRIEYETEARDIEHVDLELATREYRSQGMAAKARAGFHLFARHQDMPRLRRVLNEQELSARIFAL